MKRGLLIATMVVAATALTGCHGKKDKVVNEEQNTSTNALPNVKVEAAVAEDVAYTVSFTANLQAYKQTFIVPSLAARIDKINVEVGDHVRQGQVLVELDKTQYNTYALQLSNAETNLARMRPVYESGGISKQQIDELETNVKVLSETVRNLADNLTLRAPFDGVVTGRFNEVGDLFSMSPNAAGGIGILQVMQMNPLKAYVYVSEQYFPQVYMGMPVKVSADIYPDRSFEGKVSRISPSINSSTRTFEVEVTVPNPDTVLRPGMFTRSTFNMGEIASVTVLDMAVQRQVGTNDKFIYVVKDGVVDKRFVETGRQVGNRIEILSGVSAGENVVVAGASKLMDGMEVSIVE